MKPKHNRVMCPECFKQKMLFETQKQADNFIKWNGEDIDTHGGELRSYFCPACGGYHITSKPYKKVYEHNTENLIKRYEKALETDKLKIPKLSKAEKIETESDDVFHKFIKEIPKTMKYTKEWLRELFDAWIKGKGLELTQGVLELARHKIYKQILKK